MFTTIKLAVMLYQKSRGLKPRRLRRTVSEICARICMVEIPDPLLRRLGNPRGKAFREGRNQEPVVAKAQQK